MGDYLDKLRSMFESYGFRRMQKKNSGKDDKIHLTVRMIPKSFSDIAPKA
jgi:hypothetical protein